MFTGLRTAERDDDVVRRATASIRGGALAVMTTAAHAQERLDEATSDGELPGLVAEVRARLERADALLGDLEGRPVAYEGSAPDGAPVTGWQVPTVATARTWLDEAHDAALRALPRGAHGA